MSDYYYDNAPRLAATYESLAAARLHAWFTDRLPAAGCVLDVGAGSGRDAAWFASLGFDVVAVEPSVAMVREARAYHPSAGIHWIEGDSLPGLERTLRYGKAYDVILLSAVWMHVAPTDRERAFRKLVSLLKPGGCMAISLRHGEPASGQVIYEVGAAEIEKLARQHGAYVELTNHGVADQGGRSGITWTQLLVRLPDDGTGALPLLRQVILNDQKSSTYKPALLRTLCRIADGAAGMARSIDDQLVALPLGLVALYWLRLFKPLLASDLPQMPKGRRQSGLGFVKEGYLGIQDISALDLQVGRSFASTDFVHLHRALKETAKVICDMPAFHIQHADGRPVFPVVRRSAGAVPLATRLDEPYLWSFGEFHVPIHLWMAFQRYAVWVEPAIEAEWVRLMERAAGDRVLDQKVISTAMRWIDPERDQRVARERALEYLDAAPLHCIWSGERLTAKTLEIDHCLPWAVWPCSDLWNLLPAHRRANSRKKNFVPSSALLRARGEAIRSWWSEGYCAPDQPALRDRFESEVRASLPSLRAASVTPEDVFSGLLLQQMRLRHDQQALVWEG